MAVPYTTSGYPSMADGSTPYVTFTTTTMSPEEQLEASQRSVERLSKAVDNLSYSLMVSVAIWFAVVIWLIR